MCRGAILAELIPSAPPRSVTAVHLLPKRQRVDDFEAAFKRFDEDSEEEEEVRQCSGSAAVGRRSTGASGAGRGANGRQRSATPSRASGSGSAPSPPPTTPRTPTTTPPATSAAPTPGSTSPPRPQQAHPSAV
ncbi:hypothetical protein VPH35_079641 [Triticum aestivum]|uniref:Uncharacterized protein n=1 Tax=Aegilops tauschii subsp. strangulata TaxID=200361 RepID=A0A453IY86_AEGTS